jgi:FAD:protein FMN transferase
MPQITRRRFIAISAAAVTAAAGPLRAAPPLHHWRGVAMGAGASITLAHPDAERIVEAARAEIARLEGIFSLFQPGSSLSRLNAAGRLDAPPFELLECLSLCGAVHAATGGLFDPTIQPLWALHAERHAQGAAPDAAEIEATLARVGWDGVRAGADAVRLARPGMALTLNGVAQGYVADRVAGLMAAEGLDDILVDTGEFRALGGDPRGGDWQLSLNEAGRVIEGAVTLRDRALASSAALGTVFDAAGRAGHILDPRTGRPAPPRWKLVSVTAPRAGLADALSTAMCLMEREQIAATLAAFPEARLAHLG